MQNDLLFRNFIERLWKETRFKPEKLIKYLPIESKRDEAKHNELLNIIK